MPELTPARTHSLSITMETTDHFWLWSFGTLRKKILWFSIKFYMNLKSAVAVENASLNRLPAQMLHYYV